MRSGDIDTSSNLAGANESSTGAKREATYFAVMTTASVVGLAKNLVFAKLLGVDELAYYGIVLLTLQYGLYLANWGILNGLNYSLPVAYGRGQSGPEAAAQRALGALLVTTAITAGIYLAVVFALDPPDSQTKTALALAAITVATTTAAEFYILMLRVRRQLIPLALTFLGRALFSLVLGAAGAIAFGFKGVVVGELLAMVLVVAISARRWLPSLRPRRPVVAETLSLIRIGIPLTVSNLTVAGTYTIDRLFVVGVLPNQFGQYTFASIVVLASFSISGMLGQIVGPQVLFEHGAGLSLAGVRTRMLRLTGLLAVGSGIGFVALLAVIELARSGPFAEFGPGLDAMRILYLGAVFAVLNIYGVVLWAARRFVLVMVTTLLGSLVALAGGFALATGDPSLQDFAWLFVAAQGTSTAGTVIVTEFLYRRARSDWVVGTGP